MQPENGDKNVILINAFGVPQGKEEDFLSLWKKAASLLTDKDGFIESKLHRSLGPDARYRFVNMAKWASPQAFQAAVAQPEFQAMEKQWSYEHERGLYTVASTL